MGLLPSFLGEGAIYGRQIVATKPKAKIGVLYENDEYGQELLAGLKRGLGSHASQIVVAQSYALLDASVDCAGAGAQGIGRRHVRHLRAAEAGDPGVRDRGEARLEADGVRHVGVDRSRGDADRAPQRRRAGRRRRDVDRVPARPDEPDAASAPGVKLYRQIMKKYLPSEDWKAVAHIYGMMAAYAMVDALKHAGKNLDARRPAQRGDASERANNPFLLPGLTLSTSPSNYLPLGKTFLVRYQHGFWNVLGKPLKTS